MRRPSLDGLIRHAEKFGVIGVYETGELYLEEHELLRLRVELDAIEAVKSNGRRARRRRRPHAEQVEAARLLAAEGLDPEAIAAKLGVTMEHVRKLLRGPESAPSESRAPTRPGVPVPSLGPTAYEVGR
jgi:transcriptional regulator with XRE-family HTH domain